MTYIHTHTYIYTHTKHQGEAVHIIQMPRTIPATRQNRADKSTKPPQKK